MDRRIEVSSELRARDVPPGTTVTPRGREYTMMGLLGGWIAGGIVMYLEWDRQNPAISALKVFGAATLGSLLGTFLSWFMPGTRKRMKVIKELKVELEVERRAEAEAAQEVAGRTMAARSTRELPQARSTRELPQGREWREEPATIAAPEPQYYQSRETSDEKPMPVVYTSPGEPAPPTQRPEIDRLERKRTTNNTDALLEALEQYGQGKDDDPRNPRKK